MNAALHTFIGKICHIYIDDIVIWSNTVAEHVKHINMIMKALTAAKLFCNLKKCDFLMEMDFLGHHISTWGIELNTSKIQKILDWPVPTNSTKVWAFLGLVRYIASFLPKLAEHTYVLTPLTNRSAKANFTWMADHHSTFESIKALIVGADCLTVVDHKNPGENKIFVTCNASDWHTGVCLSFGKTWETARPVAYDSMQLGTAEKNYPIHEKELLVIIRVLKKWQSDLLGTNFTVYTDNRMLENFDTQHDLSRQQLQWQEFMSQYEMDICYIHGEDNCVVDALSCISEGTFPDKQINSTPLAPYHTWNQHIGSVLSVTTDQSVHMEIFALPF